MCTCAEYSHCALGQILLLPGQSCPPAPQGKAGLASNVQGSSSWWALHRAVSLLGWVHSWEQGGDTAFEEGQQAKAIQVLVWCGSVLLPS